MRVRLSSALLIFLTVLGLASSTAVAQDRRSFWNPPVQVFDTGVHPGDEAFYALAQDVHGSIVAGNSWGPVLFTGLTWELVPMPPPAYQPVYSLSSAADGRVYFTAQQDFGYIREDASGRTVYTSLKQESGHQYSFSSVHTLGETTYFVSAEGVLTYRDGESSFWASPEPLAGAAALRAGLFVRREDGSLCRYQAEACTTVLPNAAFGAPVRFLLDGPGDAILIGLDSGQLFTWEPGAEPVPFETPAFLYLAAFGPFSGVALRDGSFFIWTFRKGGVWVDATGAVLGVLDHEHTDIPNATINSALEDADGDLWLATNTALVHVALRAPVATLPRFGPDDLEVRGAAVIEDQLFLGTNDGMWAGDATFEPLATGVGRVFRMGAVDGTPFMFSEGHLMAIENGRAYETGTTGGRDITHGFDDESTVVVGSGTGVARVRRENRTGAWHVDRAYDLGYNVMDVAWDTDGTLWTTVEPGGVLHIRFHEETGDTLRVDHFGQVDDYPMDISQVESVWDTVVFVSDAGLVTPDPGHPDIFVPIAISGGPRFDPPGITGNIFSDGEDLLVAQFPDGIVLAGRQGWRSALLPSSREARPLVLEGPDGSRVLWTWKEGRLVRYDVDVSDPYEEAWSIRLRHVVAGDSTHLDAPEEDGAVAIGRGVESIRFEFAAPRYRDAVRTRYRYRLRGLDADWSPARNNAMLAFDVLKPGRYTLEVEGVDGQGIRSRPLTWTFVIRPPWYASNVAVLGWLILLLGMLGGAVYRWQNNRVLALERRERELEEQVAERTREIEKQAHQLKELDESKSRFFANVSHEFRTPLTLITAPILEAIEGQYGDLPEHAQQAFERARLNSDRLLRLVNQLLDLARLESGQLRVRPQKVDLARFCRRIVSMFEHAAELRGIALATDIPHRSVPVCIDREQMEKVVVNLLSNALKFTPEGGTVRFVMDDDGGRCRFAVEDTGIGIPEAALPRVFERFFQVDDGTTRAHEGMGIGLAMSRQFVRLHGGDMEVTSRLGHGSTFAVWLPFGECEGDVVDESADVPVASPKPAPVEAPENDALPIVLVVEDNADMRAYVTGLFRDDYRVLEAENGAAGMELALESIPDIIVSDLMMPEVDGIDFCRAVRADMRTSHIPFIILTAKADEESRMEGLETGADVYLEKPFRPRELRAQLGNLVRSRTRLQAHLRGESLPPEAPAPVLSAADRAFMDRVTGVSESRIFDSTFSVDVFADEVHMSRRQLLRKMKALLGESPRAYVQRVRLERARALLAEGQMVEDVSINVGYADRSSFSRAFTEYFGTPPSRV